MDDDRCTDAECIPRDSKERDFEAGLLGIFGVPEELVRIMVNRGGGEDPTFVLVRVKLNGESSMTSQEWAIFQEVFQQSAQTVHVLRTEGYIHAEFHNESEVNLLRSALSSSLGE